MYEQETIKPYDGEGEKGKLVETMFDNIAPTYDTLNHRLSWDIDKYWRKKAVKALVPYSPKKILDIADYSARFNELLEQKVNEIFSSEIPFTPSTDLKICRTCPYLQMCRR